MVAFRSHDIITEAWRQGLSYKYQYLEKKTNTQVMVFAKHRPKIVLYLPMINWLRQKVRIEIE